jgi:hypothetical protein
LWSIRLASVTEYHEASKRLTRVRLFGVPTALAGLMHTVLLLAAIAGGLIWGGAVFACVCLGWLACASASVAWGFAMLLEIRRRVRGVAKAAGVEGR